MGLRRLRNSLVLRLAVGFALTNLLLVGLGSIYLTKALKNILVREAEDDLRQETAALVRRLDQPHAFERGLRLEAGDDLLVRVLDPSGAVLGETPGMEALVPARAFRPQDGPAEAELPRAANGHRLKLLSAPFAGGWVQVARDFSREDRRLKQFRDAAAMRLVLTSLAAALVGLAIARNGLAPLRHLALQAQRIHPEALAARLKLEDTPVELVPLVEALNQSLSRLEAAFARLSALNADMAHELRTPIHSLRLETERILSQPGLPPATEDSLAGMMETLDHMAAMIGQMLFLARTEDPSTVIEHLELGVRDLLLSAREPFEWLAEEGGIRLEVAADEPLRLRGDATLLRRALHNLVDNAIRHAPSGSRIDLEAEPGAAGVTLVVRDQGEGIPAAFLTSLGQRFIRPDASRSRRTGGAGLGLAIVQSIVKLHGGQLEIRSQADRGTEVRMHFPLT
jgi:two-component system heavy metal sensor histidine kinase CusS